MDLATVGGFERDRLTNFETENGGTHGARLAVDGEVRAGGNLAIAAGGSPKTTSTNYVTCGNGNGAGSSVTYTLTGSAIGYYLTNIVVYGGWGDNGR